MMPYTVTVRCFALLVVVGMSAACAQRAAPRRSTAGWRCTAPRFGTTSLEVHRTDGARARSADSRFGRLVIRLRAGTDSAPPLAGVRVRLEALSTSTALRSWVTDNGGIVIADSLPPGSFRLVAHRIGNGRLAQQLEVRAGVTDTADVRLEVVGGCLSH